MFQLANPQVRVELIDGGGRRRKHHGVRHDPRAEHGTFNWRRSRRAGARRPARGFPDSEKACYGFERQLKEAEESGALADNGTGGIPAGGWKNIPDSRLMTLLVAHGDQAA